MNDNTFIRNHLREINESISCLWEGIIPIYSESTKTFKIVFDKTDSTLKALINKDFWGSINNYDKCFVIIHYALKILLAHNNRMKFLSDKKCASISSNIVINEMISKDYKMFFSEMSILKKICFIENTIPEEYRHYIDNDYTMEFIFTILLHMVSKKINTGDNIIIDYDNPDDLLNNNVSPLPLLSDEQNEIYPLATIDNDDCDSHDLDDTQEKSSIDESSSDKGHSSKNKDEKYMDLGSESIEIISEIISDNISRRMLEKDFPKNVNDEDSYLSFATESLSKIACTDHQENELKQGGILSAKAISVSAKKKYQVRSDYTKKIKLKKILQKKMLKSDDLDDDEQFVYRDEFLYGLNDEIRIPSIKNIGENKRNKKNIVLYIDSSGSCQGFLKSFAQRVMSLKCSDVKLRVFSFDDKVSEVKIIGKDVNIKATFEGTSFSSVVNHSNKLISDGEIDKHSLFLVLTDGIDPSFKDESKNKIKNKKQWYWFLTTGQGRKYLDNKCGNVMSILEFM